MTDTPQPASMTASGADSKSISADAPYRLMDLPAEIILRVLKFAVTISSPDDPIDITAAYDWMVSKPLLRSRYKCGVEYSMPRYTEWSQRLLQPPITRTCGLLRYEGLKIFYAANTFVCSGGHLRGGIDELVGWIRCLTEAQLGAIGPIRTVLTADSDGDFRPRMAWFRRQRLIADISDSLERFHKIEVYTRMKSDKILLGGGAADTRMAKAFQLSFVRAAARIPKDPSNWLPLEDIVQFVKEHHSTGEKWWIQEAEVDAS